MTRKARTISPTDYYHIMMRGNNRESIFIDPEQKTYFSKLLESIRKDAIIEISAYCIMSNHVHLLLKGDIKDISSIMKKINIRYAVFFNKKSDRIGHVFQDRFRSEIINDDAHFLQVIRYIHNNPVNANIVNNVQDYKWHSYYDFLNNRSNIISPVQLSSIMGLFGNNIESFINFHRQEDFEEYLDIDEEKEHNRKVIFNLIIDKFCKDNKIADKEELYDSFELIRDLIKILLSKTMISHRKIASLLKINSSIVHRISKSI